MMQVYDRIILYGNKSTLLMLMIGGSIAIILECILRIYKQKISHRISSLGETADSYRLLSKILFGNRAKIKQIGVYKVVDTLKYISEIRKYQMNEVIQAIMDLPFLIVYLGILAYFNKWLAVYNIIILAILYLLVRFIIKKDEAKSINEAEQQTVIEEFYVNSLSELSNIKAINLEKNITTSFFKLQSDLQIFNFKAKFFKSLVLTTTNTLALASLLGTVVIGAMIVVDQSMTIGGLTACTLIAGRLMQPVYSLIQFLTKFEDIWKKSQLINDVMIIEDTDHVGIETNLDGSLELRKLGVYKNKEPVFEELNFEFEKGKSYGLKDNKSFDIYPLFETILGINKAYEGSLKYSGLEFKKISTSSIRRAIQVLEIQNSFFNGTVLENITLFSKNEELGIVCANIVGLDSTVNELKDGYRTNIKFDNLEAIPATIYHKILLARILYLRPKILLIDKIELEFEADAMKSLFKIIKLLEGEMTVIWNCTSSKILSRMNYELTYQNKKIRIVV